MGRFFHIVVFLQPFLLILHKDSNIKLLSFVSRGNVRSASSEWEQFWISFLAPKRCEDGINLHHLELSQAIEGASVYFFTPILFNCFFSPQLFVMLNACILLTGFEAGPGRWRRSGQQRRDGYSQDSCKNHYEWFDWLLKMNLFHGFGRGIADIINFGGLHQVWGGSM